MAAIASWGRCRDALQKVWSRLLLLSIAEILVADSPLDCQDFPTHRATHSLRLPDSAAVVNMRMNWFRCVFPF